MVTIQATQAGNGTYAPATPVSQSFTVAPAQRGCLAFDQIKASDRTGNGNQLLTYSSVPASATSPGTPGQVAYDTAGNWLFLLRREPVRTHRPDRIRQGGRFTAVLVNRRDNGNRRGARETRSPDLKQRGSYFFAAGSSLEILMEVPSAFASPVTFTVPPAFAASPARAWFSIW